MISLLSILETAAREDASDIHITAGAPPMLRLKGEMVKLDTAPLTEKDSKELCYSIITDDQKREFENKRDLDFSFSIKNKSRFRGHLHYQQRSVSGSFRRIPMTIPNLEDLGLPGILSELGKKPYGLVLVTGPTGSGKTTTLAAMLNQINKQRKSHILTIEDPIEFLYSHENCIVTQREIGFDAPTFHQALRAALRMDPDICLLGEMRDKETIETALHVAETGHLTFGTLHTNNTFLAVDRLAAAFDGEKRGMVLGQLSQVLQGIVSQRLIMSIDGKSRVPAIEVLLFPPAIRNLVKEGKVNQIYSIMQTQKEMGMITLNQSLFSLVNTGLISEDRALLTSYEPKELHDMLSKIKHKTRRPA